MAHIRPRDTASGRRYDVVWREAGRERSRTFTRDRDARTFRTETERRLRLGLLYEAAALTLADAYADHIDRYEVGRAPSTVERRRQAWPILAPLEGLPVPHVTRAAAEDVLVASSRRAPRQAQLALALLKAVLRDAQSRGQRLAPDVLTLRAPSYEERQPRFLSVGDLGRLCSWCSEPLLVRFAALSGLRQGECFALRDTDVAPLGSDSQGHSSEARAAGTAAASRRPPRERATPSVESLPGGTAHVLVARGAYKGEARPTKSKKRRRVYLAPDAAQALREQLLARPPGTELVFPAPKGGMWRAPNFMGRVFRPAAKRAGLEGVTFHDLRHTFASLMIAAGANPLQIAEALGHTDRSGQPDATLVWRRYGHLYPGSSSEAAAALGRYITAEQARAKEATDAGR